MRISAVRFVRRRPRFSKSITSSARQRGWRRLPGAPERVGDFPMDPTALLLSRIQFGFTISFHIIFPAFTIGLAAYIATLLGMWLRAGVDRYPLLARFS